MLALGCACSSLLLLCSQQAVGTLTIRDEKAPLLPQRVAMQRQRAPTVSSLAESSSDAVRTTNLVLQLARSLMTGRRGQHGAAVVPSEAQISKATRLSNVILSSHIGEPLMAADEASVVQAIRTRLVKVMRVLWSWRVTSVTSLDYNRPLH